MPDYKPNQVVRAFAVLALVAAFVLVVVVVATSGGGSGGNGSAQVKAHGPTKRARAALSRGAWIVHPGDTLGKISLATGISVDMLIQLNPDIDPQALLEGQRITLAATSGGGAGGGGNGGTQVKAKGAAKPDRAALHQGAWIVRSGDTLNDISQETGISINTLIQLNPGLNPQILFEGQRITLP